MTYHFVNELGFLTITQKIIAPARAPSPIDPVLTGQPDNCYIFFSLKTRVNTVLLIIIT